MQAETLKRPYDSCSVEKWREEGEQYTTSTSASPSSSYSKCTHTSVGRLIDPHIKVRTLSAVFNAQGLSRPVLQISPSQPLPIQGSQPLLVYLLSALSIPWDIVCVCLHECFIRHRHMKHADEFLDFLLQYSHLCIIFTSLSMSTWVHLQVHIPSSIYIFRGLKSHVVNTTSFGNFFLHKSMIW